MKVLVIFALCAVLYFELSHGFHLQSLKYRVRREAEKTEDELETKRTELIEYAAKITISLAKDTLNHFREVIEKILEQAKKDDLKGEDVDKFQSTLDKVNKLFEEDKEIESEKSIETLFELFDEVITVMETFDKTEELTEEQKPLKKLFDDNNADLLAVKFYLEFMTLRFKLDDHVSKYIETLTDAEKEKETKLIEWYAKFKKAENGTDEFIDTTLGFFDLYDDEDDSEEKKE